MGLNLYLVFALVVGTCAGPIQDVIVADQCARQCTVSRQFDYETGKTYEFTYETELRTAIQGASEDHAGVHLSAKVYMDFLSKCELVLRLSDVTMTEHDPETSTMKPVTSYLISALESNPLTASFQDGNIEELCLSKPEDDRILNIKRGIMSLIQNNMDDINKDQTVTESDVAGECETEYTSEDKKWYNKLIKKSKNILGCTGRQGSNTAIQGIPYQSNSDVQSLPLIKSTHVCQQEVIKTTGRLQSAMCSEQHSFAPFSRLGSGATTHNTQTLTFVKEYKSHAKPVDVAVRASIQFQYSSGSSAESSRKDMESKLMEVCESTNDGVTPDTPKLFTSLVHTMKTMEIKDLLAIYQKIKGKEICSSNNVRVSKFFLDAIPMCGTIDSLKLMVQLLTSGEVTGLDADMWMTTLAFVQKPSIDMLAQVQPLLSMKTNQEKAMLSVSSLVHSICKNNPSCANFIDVKKIISLLEHKIASSCKISDDNLQTSLFALRAIGNAGYGTGAIPTLVKCIQRRDNPIEIRLSAIEAFRRIPCTVDKSRVLSVFTDTEEDSEVRISAYKTLMVCPSDDLISKVKVTLSNEEVNQVGSYVWSHLTNLMETADPHKQSIRAILDDETLQKEFDMDKRKFSRNYEKSLFLEKLNTGATAEGDLIWSSKSFIPRSAMVNLTVDLFGNAVNLFEIGGRVEGLEYFLESYFGPNGYFSQKDVQEAVDETAVDIVRADKVKRIDKRNNKVMDVLRGSLYMRVFGNELRYMNFQGLDSMFSQQRFNFLDMIMKLTKENDYQYTQSAMFMDSSLIVPTSSGFPISLTVNGTATVDIKASGKMDIMKLASYPPTLDIHGIIRPSGAVVVSSIMGIDALDTQVGIKMVSTLHSSTSVQGKVSLSEGTILNVEFDIPQEKQDIMSVRSSFYTVHRHFEREQKMITENHQEYRACTGNKLAKITGLELCGELSFPNASLVDNAPYFPLTGPVKAGLTLYKRDKKMNGYKLEARSTHTADENIIRLAFSTPNSNTDRSFGINLALNKVLGDFDASFDSPWKKADFKGTFVNERSYKGISGRMNLDGSVRFDVKASVQSAASGPGMVYTPNVQVTIPGMKTVGFSGTIKYAPWKYIETDMSLSGLRNTPIFVKSSIVNKAKLMSASASLQVSSKEVYSIDSSMQKTQFKKKIVYKSQLSIRTPTQELLAFGATYTDVYDTNVELDMVLDKIVEKPVMLKTNLITKEYKRGRLQKTIRVEFRSSLVDIKLKNKIDNRNGKTFATDMDLTYVIRRIARDNLKLVAKFINLSSKSLTKSRAAINFASKHNTGANFKLISNINHNKRHSEVEADIAYGSDFKDANKQISVAMSMDRAIKSWTDMSASVNGKLIVGSNLRITTKLDHAHQPNFMDSNVMLRLNKVAIASSLSLKDSSKKLKNLFGQFDLELPGKTIVVSQLIKENAPNDYTSTMNARFGRSKNSIITSWKRLSASALTISSNINLDSVDPLGIAAEYTLGPELYKVGGSIQKASSKYSAIATSQMKMDDSIQIAADIEYPSRHIISNFESTKVGKKYTGRADIRWNADRDDTQHITFNGNGQMAGVGNVEGSCILQYHKRTFVMNLRNSMSHKYATHVDFQWEPSKVVSFDSTFGYYVKSDSRQFISTIKLSSPFQTLKTMDVNLDHRIDAAMYQTKFDVEWNPKKSVSGTITVRRPLTLNSVDMVIIAKAPSLGYKNIQASLQHYITNGLSTTGKFVLNRQSVQVDLSLLNKGDDSTTDVKGQIDVKTSFRQLKTATVTLSHKNNGQKMDTSALVKYNKKVVGLDSSMRNKINGWNVASNGDITIRLPSDTITATWGHRNSLSEMTTTSDITWDNKRIYVKFNGLQDLSLPTGTLSAALEIQTPLNVLQDVVFQLNHLHKQGQIDSTLKVTNNGNSLATIEGKYLRENGSITSRFTATNPMYDGTVSAMLDVDFTDSPMTSRLELSLTPLQTLTIVGSYDRKSNGDMDTSLTLSVPNTPAIELSASRQTQQSSVNSVISIKYQETKDIRLESLHRIGAVNQLKLKFTSPYTTEYTAEGVIQTSRNSIRAHTHIEAEPYLSRWSMSAGMDNSNGFSGNFRINTPYPEMSYCQISVLSEPVDGSRKSSVLVEYVPGSIIKLSSTHIFNSYNDMQLTMELSTPFADMPYTSASFRHNGNLTSFTSYGEIEYVRGEILSVESTFSTTNGIQSSITIRSPYTQDISGSVKHDGYINNFASHGELTWGKTVSADIKHEGSPQRFSSSATLSCDSSTYAGSINFNSGPKITTDISIETPLPYFENIRLFHSIEGRITKFLNHAEVSVSGYGTLSSDVNADFESQLSMTISVQTPMKEFRDMKAVFTQEGSLARFSTHAEFQNGPTNFAADITWNTDPAINFEGTIRTPFLKYRLTRVSLTHEGTGNNFKLHAETQIDKVLSELDLICNIQKKYDIDLTIRNPYINTIKASIDHSGNWQKFQSKLNVRSGKNKMLSNIKFAINPTFNVILSIKSPFALLKNQQLSLKHVGSLNSFKYNMQYKCNGKTYVGDATYQNLNTFKAEMNLKGPVFRPINVAVSHDGRLGNFKSSGAMSMGKTAIQIDANLNTINGVKGNVGIVTPFVGLETINAAISHAGELKNFKSHGEITFNHKTGQVDIKVDAEHDISAIGIVTVQTPFVGYESAELSVHHDGPMDNFRSHVELQLFGEQYDGEIVLATSPSTQATLTLRSPLFKDIETSVSKQSTSTNFMSVFSYQYGSDSQLRIETTLDIDGPYSGDIQITSPMMKNVKVSFNHDGDIHDFTSNVQLAYAGQRTGAVVVFKIIPDLEATVRLTSPLTKDIDIKVGHYGPWTNCKTNGAITYGGQSHFNANGRFNYDTELKGELEISTSIPGLRHLSAKVSHDGDLSAFNCRGEMSVEENSATGDIKYSPAEGSMTISIPFMVIEGDASYSINPLSASASLKSPYTAPFKSAINFDGTLVTFKGHGEFTFNSIITDCDASFDLHPLRADISIKSPMKDIVMTFSHDGKLFNFKTQTELTVDDQEMEANVVFNIETAIEGSAKLTLPRLLTASPISASYKLDGTVQHFNGHGEFTYNNMKNEADASFALHPLRAAISIKSPLKDIAMTLSNDGTLRNFRTTSKMNIGDQKMDAELFFNIATAMKGSATLNVPEMKPMKAFFENSNPTGNMRSMMSVEYGRDTLVSSEITFSDNPLKATVSIITPVDGYKTISALFSHNGQILSFNNLAEISIEDLKTHADMSFNFGSKLEGKMSASSPFFPSAGFGFELSGTATRYSSNTELTYGSDKYSMNASIDSTSGIDASVTLMTPFKGYKTITSRVTHTGQLPQINSFIQVKTGRRNILTGSAKIDTTTGINGKLSFQSILTPTIQFDVLQKGRFANFNTNVDVRFNGQAISASVGFKTYPAISGSMSLSSPFTSPISGSFNLKSLNNVITAHIEGSVDKTTLASDASFEHGNAIGATVSIKTPFEGFQEIKGSVKLVPTYKGFTSNANVEFAGKKIETEAMSSWRQAVTGSLSIKTPFEMLRRSTADFSFDGIFPNIKAEINVKHSGKQYSINGDIDNSRGKLTVTTPFVGFEDLRATFKSQGTLENLHQEVRITYLTGKEVYASFQNTMTSDSLQTTAKLETPYTEDVLFDLLFNGHATDFSNTLTISNGDENKVTSTTTFKLAESTLDVDTSLLTILAGYSDEQKLTISYEGLLPSMKISAYARILGSYYSTDTSLQVEDGIICSFNLKTPLANLRDIAFSFEHTGSSRRFSTKSELQYDTNKITGSLQYVKYGWRRLHTSLDVRTPFTGYESSKASYSHTASVDSFECDGDVSFMNKDFNGNIRASMSPMSASISASTPFPRFEHIGADTKLSYETGSLNAEANVQYMLDKTIAFLANMDINSAPNKANIKLTTPFRGYETTEVSITNAGDLRNFQSTASIVSSIVPAMRVQAHLKYMSLTNLDGSISFTSQINNFENLRLVIKNEVLRGKYNSNMKASWGHSKTITFDGTFTDSKSSVSADMALSTPFEWIRQLNIKSETENRGTLYTETVSAQFNGKRVADMGLSTNIGDRKSISLIIRSPVQLLIDLDGSVTSKYEAALTISEDIKTSDKTFKLNGMYDPMTNAFSLKYSCPIVGFMSLDGTFDRYNTKLNMIIDDKHYGYDMATTSNNGQIMIVLPSRSLKISGSQVSGTTEGSFMWDADRDETKKIGFRSVLQPEKGAMKADITLMMPSIGKEVQIDSQLSLNKGRIYFDGKTELTYSRDTRKKFTIMSRLEDISDSWSSKNYSFTLGIFHPYTSVDVQLSSQFGKSDEKLTGGLNMKYLTAKRDTKIFSVNGAIDRVRKAFSFGMNTPMKNIEINGNAQVDSPYRLALTNKYNDNRPLNTILSFDPTKRSIDFQMNYDPENYRSEFHIGAKYVNSSAIAAEMFHVVNRQRVTDALLTLRLNRSNLIHNRIHWRPDMLTDLKEWTQRKTNSIERNLKHSADIASNCFKTELGQKAQLIGQSVAKELEPITYATIEQLESLVRMYETNEYYIRDITNAVMEVVNEVEGKLKEVSEISDEYINTLNAKLEERLSQYLEYQREIIQAAVIKLQGTSGYISSQTGGVYRIYADRAYNISMPMIKYVNDKYNNYVQYMSQMDTSSVSNMADRYSSAIYGARDVINTGLASLMERDGVKYVKYISDRVYEQGNNAYTSWEIRENTKVIANAIAEWVREEVEKEVSDLKATIMNFMDARVTVYDPKNGEIQIDFHLPIPLKSLDQIPTIDFMPYITKAKLYVPTMTSIYLPATWLQPFEAMATIQGNEISTFDGTTYNLDSSCTFMLARDYVNSSFSLVLNKDGDNKTIVIVKGANFVKIFSSGKVTVNDIPVVLPAMLDDITVTSLEGHVSVGVAGHLNVDYYKDLDTYMIKLNGYYFGKTNGLLGSYDNEPSNDMMTSFGKVMSSADRFSKTWDIGTERCR